MASFFSDSNSLPLECTHSGKQHPYAIRITGGGIVHSSLPTEWRTSSSENSIKKYFGKRAKKVFFIGKTPSFNAAYRCKTAKTAKVVSLHKTMHPIRHIENLHIYDTITWMCRFDRQDPTLKRLGTLPGLSNFKGLKCLELATGFDGISLKALRTLRNLEKLSLILGEEQFSENYRVLLDLKLLKRLDLSIFSLRMEEPIDNQRELPALANFFIEVSRLGKLDFLAMKLSDIFDKIGPQSRQRFLKCLSRTSIPAFNIELNDTDGSRIDSESLRPCIQNIDLLIIDIDHHASTVIACGTMKNTCQAIETARKKLRVFSSSTLDQGLNNQFTDSQRQDLSSKLAILASDWLGVPSSFSEMSNVKHLKSFSLNFTSLPEVIDSLFIAAFENASNLEYLKLQRDALNCCLKTDVYYCFSLISRTAAMQNLISLHLSDFSLQISFCTILSEILKNVKTLKTLRLELQTKEPTEDKAQVETLFIPENSKLTDVYIKLPQLKENMIADFIKFVLSLNELEALTLPGGNQLIETEKNRTALIDGFKRRKNLRKVSFFRVKKASLFMSSIRNNHKNPVVAKVISELRELLDLNRVVQKCCIESNEPPYQIRYKRY